MQAVPKVTRPCHACSQKVPWQGACPEQILIEEGPCQFSPPLLREATLVGMAVADKEPKFLFSQNDGTLRSHEYTGGCTHGRGAA